jgi:hypothetical protein
MKAVTKGSLQRARVGALKRMALFSHQRRVKSPITGGSGLRVCLTVELRLVVFREAEAECQKRR